MKIARGSPPPTPTAPILVAFTLDYVLWPFSTNSTADVTPPFSNTSSGEVIDKNGKVINYYKDVPKIFEELKSKNITIIGISRNTEQKLSFKLLEALGWKEKMAIVQIYSGGIINHFFRAHVLLGIRYREMLFFDKTKEDVTTANEELGVIGTVITKGITLRALHRGMAFYKRRRKLIF